MAAETQTPVHVIRSGVLSVSIWKEEGKDSTWYRVTAQRAYQKTGEADWNYSNSFNRDDLPVIGNLLNLAHGWIVGEQAKHANRGV